MNIKPLLSLGSIVTDSSFAVKDRKAVHLSLMAGLSDMLDRAGKKELWRRKQVPWWHGKTFAPTKRMCGTEKKRTTQAVYGLVASFEQCMEGDMHRGTSAYGYKKSSLRLLLICSQLRFNLLGACKCLRRSSLYHDRLHPSTQPSLQNRARKSGYTC